MSDQIHLTPPVNNICHIRILDERYCLLTLINGGCLRIARRDAARYGIAHILPERG